MVAEFFEFAFGAAVSEFRDCERSAVVVWSPIVRQSISPFWSRARARPTEGTEGS